MRHTHTFSLSDCGSRFSYFFLRFEASLVHVGGVARIRSCQPVEGVRNEVMRLSMQLLRFWLVFGETKTLHFLGQMITYLT